MAEEEIKETVGTPVETTETQEVKVETPSEAKADIIDEIKEMQAKATPKEETQKTETTETKQPTEVTGEIPDEFSSVYLALGYTPDDLNEFAKDKTEEELRTLVPYLESYLDEPEEKKEDVKEEVKTEVKSESKMDETKTAELEKEIAERIEKQLSEKFGVSLEEIKQFKEERTVEQKRKTADVIINKLDEAAKEFPIFGKHSELPAFGSGKLKGRLIPTSPAFQARDEVTKSAQVFMNSGHPIDKAMDKALALYRGEHLQTEVRRSVIKELKGFEKNLSGTRTGKDTVKKYGSTREEVEDYIRQLQQAHGIDK